MGWKRKFVVAISLLAAACGDHVPGAPAAPSGAPPVAAATAPSITSQPESQTIASGQSATLTVAAGGTAPLTFQWYSGTSGSTGTPIGGATNPSVTTPVLTTSASYWVRVANVAGTADSNAAMVSVMPASPGPSPPAPAPPPAPVLVAPSIATQPQSQTIASGQSATLSVGAIGSTPLTYQWYSGASGTTGAPAAGATGATFTTPALAATISYWVRIGNAAGQIDSATATVTVTPPPPPAAVAPTITSQPQSQGIAFGQSATLSVAATGTLPIHFQWFAGPSGAGAPIAGATSTTFSTPALTTTTSYWVRVSNTGGTVDSAAAIITVAPDAGNSAFEDQVLTLVNQQRAAGATCGVTPYSAVPALTMNASLRNAARAHSLDMATQNYFSHSSLDGRTFDQRMGAAGYNGAFPWGENIAAGQTTPTAVVNGWMASPGHCTNIMNGGYRVIGVGYAFRAGSPYGHYWTQNFGGS